MAQYFSVDPARTSASTGMIRSRPKDVIDAGNERLLGGSPARQIGILRIVQEGPSVMAQIQVMQQRQGSNARVQMGYSEERHNYNMNPGTNTPASIDAATTPEQNETWTNEKRRTDIEQQILDDLYKRLHGAK
jgi:hypothetical protein